MHKNKTKLKVVKGEGRKKSFDESAFYKSYPHVVKGSVKEAKVGSKVGGVKVAHGRICQIKCQESGELRTINVQDAHQVRFSVEVQKKKSNQRAAELRRRANGKTSRARKAKA